MQIFIPFIFLLICVYKIIRALKLYDKEELELSETELIIRKPTGEKKYILDKICKIVMYSDIFYREQIKLVFETGQKLRLN